MYVCVSLTLYKYYRSLQAKKKVKVEYSSWDLRNIDYNRSSLFITYLYFSMCVYLTFSGYIQNENMTFVTSGITFYVLMMMEEEDISHDHLTFQHKDHRESHSLNCVMYLSLDQPMDRVKGYYQWPNHGNSCGTVRLGLP